MSRVLPFRMVHKTAFNHGRVSVNAPSLLCVSRTDVVLWYFGGSWEGRGDVALWSQSLSQDPDGSWCPGPEHVVLRVPGFTVGNAVPILGAHGALHVFVAVSRPGSWDDSQVWRLDSTDGGRTYHEPVVWRAEPGTMVGTPALAAADGSWILPLYSERDWDVWTVRIAGPDLRIVGEGQRVSTPGGCIQLCLAETTPWTITGFLRTRDAEIYRTSSADGLCFSVPHSTGIPNPNSRVAAVPIGADRSNVVLVYNPASEGRLHLEGTVFATGRTCLRAALSLDGGRTFPRQFRRDLEVGTGEYAYPWAVARDGAVLLAYQAQRCQIRVCEITRDWFLEDHQATDPETFDEAVDDLRLASTQPSKEGQVPS